MKTLLEIQKAVHANAVDKGWYQDRDLKHVDTFEAMEALIHSEIAEATECIREGQLTMFYTATLKPCGLPSEIADIVIRILDYQEAKNLYIPEICHEGNDITVDEEGWTTICLLTWTNMLHKLTAIGSYGNTVMACFGLARALDFDLDAAILEKHEYNMTRSHRHGGKLA